MPRYEIARHAGPILGVRSEFHDAWEFAKAEAQRYGHRVNVYPRASDSEPAGVRIVSCYPACTLWESDLQGLSDADYVAAHRMASGDSYLRLCREQRAAFMAWQAASPGDEFATAIAEYRRATAALSSYHGGVL